MENKNDITVKVSIDTKAAESSVESLKKTIDILKGKLDKLDPKSENFVKYAQELGKAQQNMNELTATIDVLGSKYPKLNGFVDVGNAIKAGFTATKSAAELFGIETGKLEAVISKVSAAEAVANSVRQVANALKKEGNIATVFSTVYTKANAAATWLATVATKAFGMAVGATGKSFKALKVAIVSSGVGAFLVLLGVLIGKIMEWTDSTEKQKEMQEEQNRKLEEKKKLQNDIADGIIEERNAREGGLNSMKKELRLMEAQGASSEALYKKREEIHKKELLNLKIKLQANREFADEAKKISEEIAEKEQQIVIEKTKFNKENADRAEAQRNDETQKRQQQLQLQKDNFLKANENELRLLELKGKLTFEKELEILNKINAKKLISKEDYEIKKLEIENKWRDIAEQERERSESKVSGLIQKIEEERSQLMAVAAKANEDSNKIIEEGYERQINELRKQKIKGELTEKEFAARELAIETEKLNTKKSLQEKQQKELLAANEQFFIAEQNKLIESKDKKLLTDNEYEAAVLSLISKTNDEKKGLELSFVTQNSELQKVIDENSLAQLAESKQKEKDIEEHYFNLKKKLQNDTLQLATILGDLLQKEGQKQNNIQKGVALVKIGIDTANAISSAIANANSPTPDNVATGGIAGIAKFVTISAQILAASAQAKKVLNSGGNNSSAKVSATTPSIAAPQIAVPRIGGTQIISRQHNAEPIKVFVSEADIRKSQQRVKVIEGQSVVV